MVDIKSNREGQTNVLAPSEQLNKADSLEELIKTCPKNKTIGDNLIIAWSKINSSKYKKICCSISGGSDSDVMLDIIWRCDKDNKVEYVWFDTGLEYQATKNHLKYLEEKYGIEIIRYKAIKPIPVSCKEYGQPFLSKYVSEMIHRLQGHNFKWEDKSFDELYKEYPTCKIALNWWCNHSEKNKGEESRFNISRNKYLKEFMLQNPPQFKISNKCCNYAKKNISHKLIKEYKYDLMLVGVRKAEGGSRAASYKNCFTENDDSADSYRPLFWYSDKDKNDYKNAFSVIYSDCYMEYGLDRTGCAGCPFGKYFEHELEVVKEFEPKLYKAANFIFKDSYEYTRKYREFCKEMRSKEKELISDEN